MERVSEISFANHDDNSYFGREEILAFWGLEINQGFSVSSSYFNDFLQDLVDKKMLWFTSISDDYYSE